MRYFLHLLIFVIIIQDAAFADSPGHTESNAPREHDPNMKRTEKLKKAKVVILCPPFDSSPCFALRTIGEELVARGHDVSISLDAKFFSKMMVQPTVRAWLPLVLPLQVLMILWPSLLGLPFTL